MKGEEGARATSVSLSSQLLSKWWWLLGCLFCGNFCYSIMMSYCLCFCLLIKCHLFVQKHTQNKYKSTVPVLVVLVPKGCFSKGYNFVNQWRKTNETTCCARLCALGRSSPALPSSPPPQRTGGTLSLSKSNLRLGAPSCRALTLEGSESSCCDKWEQQTQSVGKTSCRR